jgi:6-phosphogluconolactonase
MRDPLELSAPNPLPGSMHCDKFAASGGVADLPPVSNGRSTIMSSLVHGLDISIRLAVVGLFAALVSASGVATAGDDRGSVKANAEPEVFRAYVGTYTSGSREKSSKGIYLMELDLRSGTLGTPQLAAEAIDPSFLAVHPSRKFLYAVSERGDVDGRPGGAVLAFAIDPSTGRLTALNQQSSRGSGPCHLVVDATGKNVLVANYGSGSVACLPIETDGRLRESTSFIQHKGSGADPRRQNSPHAHSINLDAAGRFAVVADLGLDRVFVNKFNPAEGKLAPNDPPFTKVTPGSGPRHFAFHPDGRFAYVINEMANTVTGFTYDAGNGGLSEIQTITTLPSDFKGRSSTAEVQVHPSGRFLYGSNRGHNSIAIFAIDPKTGKLDHVGFEATEGKNPRNFAIDPTGSYLLAENMDSGTIVVFHIDPRTGALRATGQVLSVPRPVCIKMIPKL